MERFKITAKISFNYFNICYNKVLLIRCFRAKKGQSLYFGTEFVTDPNELTEFSLSQLSVYGFARPDSPANSIMHSHKALTEKVAVMGHACDIRDWLN